MARPNFVRIAREIDKAMLATPNVPEEVLESGDVLGYVKARVKEVAAIYNKYGVKPQVITVYCNPNLIKPMPKYLVLKQGYKTSIKTGYPIAKDGEAGSFLIEVTDGLEADGPWVEWIKGVSYNQRVSRKEFESRWVFQVVDKMEPRLAKRIARTV